jgi:hypothetical protein
MEDIANFQLLLRNAFMNGFSASLNEPFSCLLLAT